MKKIQSSLLLLLFLFSSLSLSAQDPAPRDHYRLREGWKFSRQDDPSFARSDYNDRAWTTVLVPHDWAIYGPFSIHNDRQNVAITQDGQKEAMEHAGRTGGLPFVGVGWYRNRFDLTPSQLQGTVTLRVDGAMSHARVYLNDQFVGEWPYGYNSFHFDLTPYAREHNTLAIRLQNETDCSRWYPGAGLYRNIYVVVTPSKYRIAEWGTYITTPKISEDRAEVSVRTKLSLPQDVSAEDLRRLRLTTTIRNGNDVVATAVQENLEGKILDNEVHQTTYIPSPKLWSPEEPHLYEALSTLVLDGKVVDSYKTTFGVRTLKIVPHKGMFLNGKPIKFRGVCNHHDLGPLGAEVNPRAIRRQVSMLKEMGANAIRTSHNMPAPELVQACDEMGMMLMVETFDEWRIPKVKNGYNKLFDQWAEKDLVNVIHHYRNSPSVMMWCIGNEVYEQGSPSGNKVAYFLQEICHREDPTRPVTQGMDQPDNVLKYNFASMMDVAGFNYRPHYYPREYKELPQGIIMGAETASTVSSRGVYKFPVERQSMKKYPDHQASSYDVEHCGWSNLPEDDFLRHDDNEYCIGEFVWTGFDYLGEPTPYYTDWPSHSSLFGIIDLAGIPKDRYYLYRSHWNRSASTLHLLPHWDWPERVGEKTPVFVYTSYPTVELFVNGRSLGKRSKDMSINAENSGQKGLERLRRYRLIWDDVLYEPGRVKAVAYDESGREVETFQVETPGGPYALRLTPENSLLKADGEDLAFVRVEVVDREGRLCPRASHLVKFKVSGEGEFRAAANGDPTCLNPFHRPEMPLFSGALTAVVRSTKKAGKMTLRVTAKGLRPAMVELSSRS